MHRGKASVLGEQLLVEEKDKRKGWTRMAQDWEGRFVAQRLA